MSQPARDPGPRLEEVLAEGLALSHRDATVARVLPLVLWRHWDRLDHGRLVRAATRRNERQSLGFFLELTGRLGGDPRLASLSESLRDRRRSRARPFFAGRQGRMALALARKKTPPLARQWGYLMNMGMDSFASAFAKHGSDRSGKAGPVHGAPPLQGAALPVETPANDASRHSAFPSRKAGQYGRTMGSSKPAV